MRFSLFCDGEHPTDCGLNYRGVVLLTGNPFRSGEPEALENENQVYERMIPATIMERLATEALSYINKKTGEEVEGVISENTYGYYFVCRGARVALKGMWYLSKRHFKTEWKEVKCQKERKQHQQH